MLPAHLTAALTQQEVFEADVGGELAAGHGFYVLDVVGQTQSRYGGFSMCSFLACCVR